jgi:hypothetical protein
MALPGRRLWREPRERGYRGACTAVTDQLRQLRPAPLAPFEVRFETPPGAQAQVDFAQFQVVFTKKPAVTGIVWLFGDDFEAAAFLDKEALKQVRRPDGPPMRHGESQVGHAGFEVVHEAMEARHRCRICACSRQRRRPRVRA